MARKLCTCCNVRAEYTGGGDDPAPRSSHMCNPCYTEGGYENMHNDEGHTTEEPKKGCWICHPELNLAQATYVKQTREGHHSPRRPQINHRACDHAQTPLARRTCRKLYWAKAAMETADAQGTGPLAAAPVLTAQYTGLVTWEDDKGKTWTGTIAKDLGKGCVRIHIEGRKLGRIVAFTRLRIA